MKLYQSMKRYVCFILAICFLASFPIAQKTDTVWAAQKPGYINLNGTWDFWPDLNAETTTIAIDNEANATPQVALSSNPTTISLNVPNTSVIKYAKVTALVDITSNSFTSSSQTPSLSVSVNGGIAKSVSLEGLDFGRKLWVDLPLNPADLKNGQNTLSLTATPANTVKLYGNSRSALSVRIVYYKATSASWQDIKVPGAWEGNFKFSPSGDNGNDQIQSSTNNGTPYLQLEVNGNESFFDLTDYKKGVNTHQFPIDISALINGNNTVIFDSNVINKGQGQGNTTSIDLILANPKSAPSNGTGYWENSNFKQFASNEDYHVTLLLQRKDNDQWVSVATHLGDNASKNLLVGVFETNGASYRPQVTLPVSDLSNYKAAKLEAMMNIGGNLTTSRNYDGAVIENAAAGDPILRVGTNSTKTWTNQSLNNYKGTTSNVMIPISVSSLVAGNNSFYFHSNAMNDNNMSSGSVDLMIEDDTTYRNSAYSQDALNSFNDMGAENLRFQVSLALKYKNTGKWIEVAPYTATANRSLVVGKFNINGLTYIPRVTLSVDNPDLYSDAVIMARVHVGNNVRVAGTDSVTYDGVGWYNRKITIPTPEIGTEQVLFFEAIDYFAEIFVNGVFIGSHEGGYEPFDISLERAGDAVNYDGENTITIRVTDQSSDPITGQFPIKETPAGFLQDTIGINYGGIWGGVTIEERGKIYADHLYVETDIDNGIATMNATVYNPTSEDKNLNIVSRVFKQYASSADSTATIDITVKAGERKAISIPIKLKECILWEIDNPHVYSTDLIIFENGEHVETLFESFGMRRITRNGKDIVFNGKNIFLTGWITWETEWDTIAPRQTEQEIRQKIIDLKNYGFNAIKFCLVVPPDYVLDVCDEMGIYVYIEYPIWEPTQSESFFTRCYDQIPRLVEKDRNHPSVIMSDFACELIQYTTEMDNLLNHLVNKAKQIDPNRLYTENSTVHVNKYGDFRTVHPYYSLTNFDSYIDSAASARGDYPVILGEYADSRTLSRYQDIIDACDGKEPWWWSANGAPPNTYAVLKSLGFSEEQIVSLQDASYSSSEEAKRGFIEASRSNPYVQGLFLTQLVDIRHNTCGFYDELGNLKYSADELRGSAQETTILIDDNTNQKRNFTAGKAISLPLSLSHFNGLDITNGTLDFTISDGDKVVQSGNVYSNMSLMHGKYYAFGECLNFTLPDVGCAKQYVLNLTLKCDNFTVSNHWDIWGYPSKKLNTSKSVCYYDPTNLYDFKSSYPFMNAWSDGANPSAVITTTMTAGIEAYLNAGGRVIYIGGETGPVPGSRDTENFTNFTSSSLIFFPNQNHPLVSALDSNGYGGAQFIPLTSPLVQPYQASGINGKVIYGRICHDGSVYSYLSEYSIGSGKLLQCSLRLHSKATGQLIAGENPLGAHIVDSMLRYTLEESFTSHEQNLIPIYHLGLSTADENDPSWPNYHYVAQPITPNTNKIHGAQIALNLTSGQATVHMELRSDINGVPIAVTDKIINSKGDGMYWYDVVFNKSIDVSPYTTYYLVYYLTDRGSGNVCIVYGSDLGANGASHPGMVWNMSSGLPITFTSHQNQLQFGFKLMNQNEALILRYGDIDCNGVITSSDSLAVLQYSVEKIEFTNDQLQIADIDGNDVVNTSDALRILQKAVGKIDKFPIE